MTAENSLLVDHTLVPIGEGFDPYPADGVWAQPSVEHAAALMRRVFDDREFAAKLGTKASADIRRTHSAAAAGEILAERLELIRATGRARPGGWSTYTRSPALASLPLKVNQRPSQMTGQQRPSAREYARRTALRAMRPYTAYQRSVNGQIADALKELSESLTHVRHESAAELARNLAEVRSASDLRGLQAQVEYQAHRIDELERRLAEVDERRGGTSEVGPHER
jgi:hypothetical protein